MARPTVTRLIRREVEKPWGREHLPAPFDARGRRIGEIWFEAPGGAQPALLVKYLFTGERLSVQVHPDDAAARARGLANGKSECWFILDAEPDAALGLGLKEEMDADALRRAAGDGSILDRLDWLKVRKGDFFSVPAGTIHAIGAGLSLIEVQQHSETTYRLYDYGRPRELHLEDGVAVARRGPYSPSCRRHAEPGEEKVLLGGPLFSLIHLPEGEGEIEMLKARERWAIPLTGIVEAGGARAGAGDCLLVAPDAPLVRAPGTRLLLAATGAY
jgi:mannose-6-phosphate isomerase